VRELRAPENAVSVRTVAVLGGGHGALATAGDLALRGYDVRLALRNRERFADLFAARRVRLTGRIEGDTEVAWVGDDHAEAVRGADLVVVPLPGHAQPAMAERVAGALERGQVVYLTAGTFGSYVFAETVRRCGGPRVLAVENATLPYGVRATGGSSAHVGLLARHLPSGVYPAAATAEALGPVSELYPATEPVEDALSAGLLNFDGALHAPLVLMNAGSIENLPAFDIHVEGNPPSVVRVSVALDEERIALREALGYGRPHWPLADLYSRRGETFYGVLTREGMERDSVWREKIGFDHRYVHEDIGCGLALWSSLGRRLGVQTPLSDAFLAIASAVNGVDYARSGRTLENLGLADASLEQLREWLTHGRDA
jgi:opine dehydrogenase